MKFKNLSNNLKMSANVKYGKYEFNLIHDDKKNYIYITFIDSETQKQYHKQHCYLNLESYTLRGAMENIKDYIFKSIFEENKKLGENPIPILTDEKIKELLNSLVDIDIENLDDEQENLITKFDIRVNAKIREDIRKEQEEEEKREEQEKNQEYYGKSYEDIRTEFYNKQPKEVRDRLHTSTTNYYEDIFSSGYLQTIGVIYRIDKDKKTEEKKHIPFANFSIDNITRVRDSTKLETEPYFDLVFYNNYDKELQIIYNQTMPNIINELIKQNLFMSYKKEQVKLFFSNLLFYLNINDELQTEKRAFYDGFFLNKQNNKIIDNSNIKDLRYNENYTNDDIIQALQILENIINFKQESRYNNAYVYKWGLGAPFHWILKELGTANNNIKMLVLYGEPNTGKSQILLFTLWFYGIDIGKYNNVVETLSSLTKEMNIDTYPVILDDAYELLNNKGIKSTLKTSTYNIYSRSVTDMEDKNNNKLYLALSTIAASYNENKTLEDGEQRRYFNINYTSDMRLNKEDIDKFNKQFKPTKKGSILECWKYIGAEFRDYLQNLIFNNDDLLYNLEELTTQFFRDLYKKVDRISYTPLITNIENNTDQFVNKVLIIQNYFNNQIRKVLKPSNQGYTKMDIEKAINTNILPGFYKLPTKSYNAICNDSDNYFICAGEFKTIIQNVTNNVMDIKSILSELELLNNERFIELNTDPETNILILNKQQQVAGRKNKRGFYISVDEIATHILNVQLINGDYPEEEWLKEASTERD